MRKGFLLSRSKCEPRAEQLPTRRYAIGRSATEPPSAERFLAQPPATELPAALPDSKFGSTQREVLCLMGSLLASFSEDFAVLNLCRQQGRKLAQRDKISKYICVQAQELKQTLLTHTPLTIQMFLHRSRDHMREWLNATGNLPPSLSGRRITDYRVVCCYYTWKTIADPRFRDWSGAAMDPDSGPSGVPAT